MGRMSVLNEAARALGATPSIRSKIARAVVLLVVVALASGLTATVVSAGTLPPCRFADITTAQRSYAAWPRTLLDTTYRLTGSYAPRDLRSTVKAGLNRGPRVRALVIHDLKVMARAARAARVRLAVQSGYRTFANQRATFAYWVRVLGYRGALTSSARAGHSEHQLGTTVDFRSVGGSAPWNYRDWGATKAGTWLRKNAWKYGFVMSYPKGKSSVTCYDYEPWHFRYVGRPTAAKVRASHLTLREYLWRAQPTPAPTPSPTPSVNPSNGPSPDPSPVS